MEYAGITQFTVCTRKIFCIFFSTSQIRCLVTTLTRRPKCMQEVEIQSTTTFSTTSQRTLLYRNIWVCLKPGSSGLQCTCDMESRASFFC